jgi:hypothetical protein
VYFDIEKSENMMRRYGCGHIGGKSCGPQAYPGGLTRKGHVSVKLLIVDREFERTETFVVRNHEILKPEAIIEEMTQACEEEAMTGK